MAGIVAALYARTVGLGVPPFGGDERYIVLHALKFGTGDLNPHFFDWPASPLMYATFFAYGVYYALGRLAGWFHSAEAFGLAALFTPDAFYLVPRLISSASGIAAAIAVWKGLARVTGPSGCALGAAMVLAAPIHIEFSRLGLADVPMTAAVAWVAAIAIQLATDRSGAGHWRLGAALVGLATSLKYQGALSVVPLVAGLILGLRGSPGWQRIVARRLAIMAGIALGAFFLLTPFALLDAHGFLADLRFQAEHQAGGVVHYGASYPAHPLNALVGTVLPAAFGWTPIAGAVCGLVVALLSRSYRVATVLVTGGTVFAVAALKSSIMAQHYALPMLPFLAMLAAVTTIPSAPLRSLRSGLALMLAASLAFPLVRAVGAASESTRPTTEQAVVDWLLSNTSSGAPIAMEDSLPIVPTRSAVDREFSEATAAGLTGRAEYWQGLKALVGAVDAEGRRAQRDTYVLYDADRPAGYLDALQKAGVCTVVRFERNVNRFSRTLSLPGATERLEYYRELERRGDLVREFASRNGRYRGAAYQVYRLRDCLDAPR